MSIGTEAFMWLAGFSAGSIPSCCDQPSFNLALRIAGVQDKLAGWPFDLMPALDQRVCATCGTDLTEPPTEEEEEILLAESIPTDGAEDAKSDG